MASAILTIAIGTYNRPQYIQRQVRDLLPQIVGTNVKLVVYDNCSDTRVDSLFSDEELSHFSVIRNSVNIGRDQNQVRCIENVDRGWVWTLSDDDKIKNNAVQIVLDLIAEYKECCYINTGNKKDKQIYSLLDLLNYFKIYGTFGISFFQSECLYNVDIIKKSVCYFNEFLSSQIGQICMVIKHFENNPNSECVFLSNSLLEKANPGGWDALHLISNTSILFEKFHYNKRLYSSSLFKSLCDMDFMILTSKKTSFCKSFYLFRLIVFKMGFFNIVRYNFVSLSSFFVHMILPQGTYKKIRRHLAHHYNTRISK